MRPPVQITEIAMRIGYLGVGSMGQPMAEKLLDAGHELWICDVREEAMRPLLERQAHRAASAKELADACKTIVVSLPTLATFREAVTGQDGLLSGTVLETLVNTCTVGAPFLTEIETACVGKGITVIDAPISGGPVGARAGTLAVMVSGDSPEVARLMPIFRLWGPTVVIAGVKPGAAQIMKLTNNIIFAVSLIATAEGMTMATTAGIAAEAMLDILNAGTARNFATTNVFPKAVVPRTFDFGATMEILMKDVDLAVAQGEALGVPMWVCQAARLVLKHGIFQGRGSHDMSRTVQIIEEGMRKA
jgi:3-hydroxyisobutyrate dehydrogenase-like beta-hydroxyacid dehydrogenase